LPERFLAFGIVVTLGHAGLAGYGLTVLGDSRLALFFGLCAVLTALVAGVSYRALRRGGGDDDSDGGGGGGPEPEPQPPWWPDFERAFWDDVRRRRDPRGRPNVPA
jgi:hypothetical protein